MSSNKANNLRTIAILNYVYGGLGLLGAFFVLIYLGIGIVALIAGVAEDEPAAIFVGSILMFISIIVLILVIISAIVSALCGYFIQIRKYRIFCIVVSGLTSLNFPIGTALGVFTIIELEKKEVKMLFEQNS